MLLHPERLIGIEINVANAALAIADKVKSQLGVDTLIVFGYRSVEAQDALYAQGRTAPGNIVTQAPGGMSAHNYNCAVDLVVMNADNSACDWNNIYINSIMKVICEQNPLLLWGGDYTGSFKDYDHIEAPIWQQVKAGTAKIIPYASIT